MIELAIVGAGAMGSLHARVAMGLRDARVSVVVDPDRSVGEPLARRVGAEYAADVQSVVGEIQAAIVAVPTPLHRELGEYLFRKGVNVLIEKPMALTIEDAISLESSALDCGVVFMVGHVERFNPVVLELAHIIEDPIHVDISRVGRFSSRVGDSVVLDLMVHDLDIACEIFNDYNPTIQAVGQSVVTRDIDIVTATLTFSGSRTAVLTASRLGQHKIRRLEVTQRESFIAADLLRQTIQIQRATRADLVSAGGYRQESVIEVPYLRHHGEPLLLEHEHFIDCVLTGSQPITDGAHGRRILQLAFDVISQVE